MFHGTVLYHGLLQKYKPLFFNYLHQHQPSHNIVNTLYPI